ncbi:DNA-deoxyinosine glycosylase [Altererythrobacter sp. SALINAS58]|uniref:DNA-deoxyinosine glycosylase n=1 Tax=Alteripontixanthobacter muriae TaxID=2705546 RepID=UPI0015769687|nr:DNA-deoxyinosine glycosylase [Alteripontixanthobacter muriae]NTZ41739.1 DNA-deoxyinosine glycosylase [Alteripontixanthobacter muriae]
MFASLDEARLTQEVRKSSFAPVVDANTRVLVLGSLPGERSLQASEYYAHPRNAFWRLVGEAIGVDVSAEEYGARLDILREHGIGLWDSIGSARRRGSLDTALRDIAPAPIAKLVNSLPELRAVAFNGIRSAQVARPQLVDHALALIDLPSSSPAYARMSFAQKASEWARLAEFTPQSCNDSRRRALDQA